MRNILILGIIITLLISCSRSGSNGGELMGVAGRNLMPEPEPFGMVKIPSGSFEQGNNDEDVAWALYTRPKEVTVTSFWMDDTEITNNEYRQFVYWVRDSIFRKRLGREGVAGYDFRADDAGNPLVDVNGDNLDIIDWQLPMEMTPDVLASQSYVDMLYPQGDRKFAGAGFDVRRFVYIYNKELAGLEKLANKQIVTFDSITNEVTITYDGVLYDPQSGKNKVFNNLDDALSSEWSLVYPDTMVWCRDFTYSYNVPWKNLYFAHSSYDDYPVVGVTWRQADAFCHWRGMYLNMSLEEKVHDFSLPTEAEWEFAARGELKKAKFPWGSHYTRSGIGPHSGCFLANFYPIRGRYADDGFVLTSEVGKYWPNYYGLFDMAGNVAEWTRSSYDFGIPEGRLNPDNPDPTNEKRVIKGGSWKDISYYLECGTRSYEYRDSSKSYIGFRCIRPCLGSPDVYAL